MANQPHEKKTYQSTKDALERRLQCYPPAKYCNLTKALARANGMREGQVVTVALKEYFDRMPEQERQRILSQGGSSNHY